MVDNVVQIYERREYKLNIQTHRRTGWGCERVEMRSSRQSIPVPDDETL